MQFMFRLIKLDRMSVVCKQLEGGEHEFYFTSFSFRLLESNCTVMENPQITYDNRALTRDGRVVASPIGARAAINAARGRRCRYAVPSHRRECAERRARRRAEMPSRRRLLAETTCGMTRLRGRKTTPCQRNGRRRCWPPCLTRRRRP
jgi:hypothetical protein